MKLSDNRMESLGRVAWRISFLLFAALLALMVKALHDFDFSNDGYILGDWLINFQDGGFKRRGLSGSFFFLLQDITGLQLQFLVFATQSLAYIVLFICLYLLFRGKFLGLDFLVFVWSPLTLMVYLADPKFIGRKEILLFILFSLYALSLVNGRLGVRARLFFVFSLVVATLFHELPFFYIPYFLLLNHFHQGRFRLFSTLNVGLVLSVALPVMMIALFGGEINNGQSSEILMKRGVEFSLKDGANGILFFEYPDEMIIEPRKIVLCLVIYLYALLLLGMAVPVPHRRTFILMFIGCTLYSIPLFIVAYDWGRWLHIHFMMGMIAASTLLPSKDRPAPIDGEGWVARRLWLYAAFMLVNATILIDHVNGPFLNKRIVSPAVKNVVGRILKR